MNLYYHRGTGILMYSNVSLFNYNSSNPGQWYNHTFIREMINFETHTINPVNPDNLVIIIIIIVVISAASITGLYGILKYYNKKKISEKPLKHNPKQDSKIKKRT